MNAQTADITALLSGLSRGDGAAEAEVFRLLYAQLKALAQSRLAREFGANTLSATGLVHEAYLRLTGSRLPTFSDRGHFMALAANVMRRVLVDRARSAGRVKRGDAQAALTLDENSKSWAFEEDDLWGVWVGLQRGYLTKAKAGWSRMQANTMISIIFLADCNSR